MSVKLAASYRLTVDVSACVSRHLSTVVQLHTEKVHLEKTFNQTYIPPQFSWIAHCEFEVSSYWRTGELSANTTVRLPVRSMALMTNWQPHTGSQLHSECCQFDNSLCWGTGNRTGILPHRLAVISEHRDCLCQWRFVRCIWSNAKCWRWVWNCLKSQRLVFCV